MSLSINQILLASITGLLLHWSYFIHGEHDLEAANIARAHIISTLFLACFKSLKEGITVNHAIYESFLLHGLYAVALFISIVAYRLFCSPSRSIPGPLSMRVSKLVHVWRTVDPTRQNCIMLNDLRKEYGDVVRTGPNEVTLFGHKAYTAVHGPDSRCGRATYYDILHPMVSLDTTRDPVMHAYRRKLWDKAFSIKALQQIEGSVYTYADRLVEQLRYNSGKSINIADYIEYCTFDLMGHVGLDIEFNALTAQKHPILGLWHIAHAKLGPLNAAPWIKHLLMGVPYIERLKYYREFMSWAHDELDKNIKDNPETRHSLMGYIITDAIENGGIQKNWNVILGDFLLVIAAGSDPVRIVLTFLIRHLIRSPEHLVLIRKELSSINSRDYKALQYLEHLNACIYETLRLYPAVPSAGLRLPPNEGITVNGVFIPKGTTLVTPQYSLHRDEKCFLEPEKWIPERFTSKPELILEKNAFVPWSIGKMSCLGKNLSLLETRVCAAALLSNFDFEFAPGESGSQAFTGMVDYFTASPGPMNVVLKERVVC
ncbi:cytochrome P450 [Xylaria curta]|nr:cytochrome P450 [Xylaria curta]